MTFHIQPIDWSTIELQIQTLLPSFHARQAEIHALSEQLEDLQHSHCTGTEHWRDAKHSKHTPKLYVIHKTDQSCPIHGKPEAGKRIRTYVGSNQIKIDAARAAIERGKTYHTAMLELKRKHQDVHSAKHSLHNIYWALKMNIPSIDPEEPE